ncbi:hypothetical protein NDU88_003643 [Pleurodeles waltl]|uniref:Uncharacterized protein n=1 Tax=Pleurodeles waltl TaxID=8319 RepID=A0AAV7KY03_PLEWA|nr:hypothetical protein NDU88_003643 [Pleurodeles waltl]
MAARPAPSSKMGTNDTGKERRRPDQRRHHRQPGLPRGAPGAPPPQKTTVRSWGGSSDLCRRILREAPGVSATKSRPQTLAELPPEIPQSLYLRERGPCSAGRIGGTIGGRQGQIFCPQKLVR